MDEISLQQQVLKAMESRAPLRIAAGGTKAFMGQNATGTLVDLSRHSGIIEYDPRELVLTARSGTKLSEIEKALADAGQMLAFEPPHFGSDATLGGTISTGLSGPRRPYSGSARDFVLGCRVLNGKGEIASFGGQVMKNVAGYDVSRLLAGSHGTLGILLEISLKVLPKPASSITVSRECSQTDAISIMSEFLSKPYPVDGACHDGERAHLRISGSEQAVKEARKKIPGDILPDADQFWHGLREQTLPFFHRPGTLYRIAVKPASKPLHLSGHWLLDWGGAQRWLYSEEDVTAIRHQTALSGGHVTAFRNGRNSTPLPSQLLALHQRLKAGFDPEDIFNRGHIFATL